MSIQVPVTGPVCSRKAWAHTSAILAALFLSPALASASAEQTPHPETSAISEPRLINKSKAGHTYAMPEDYLAVTVAPPVQKPNTDPLDSDLSIWVGEVEIEGRKTLWVELIDKHGEVIYNTEIHQNETHLLPDGRAIAVTVMHPKKQQTMQEGRIKKDQSRISINERFVVTQKEAFSPALDTQVNLLEVRPVPKQIHNSFMLRAGKNGELIWKATKDAITWLESDR
ncbi:hypothetical protein [Pseudovibrio sp. Tun.PSC04-5.I4]|uniref:hypothetical protein n=1 Tax=Pseudovibrio sp. Tun.PSC04-5.I4 TaxID=1798213 RepID=UPI00088C9434|nr:hypothetical protein [Pseudovibrio sp. Tun.PSC04-5.I4]SDR11500.1 hypothetical protein SAMN04515695_2844 [Pseudovibrio sp. Tun.PSC04-5.I4]